MEISAITDPAALNGIADLNRKTPNVVVQQQPQPEKAIVEQQPEKALSYSQSGITVNISEQGMAASKKNEIPAAASTSIQAPDYNKMYLEVKKLVDENLPDLQIRDRTQVSETELERIRRELSSGYLGISS